MHLGSRPAGPAVLPGPAAVPDSAVVPDSAPPPPGLTRRTGFPPGAFAEEQARRAAFLTDLVARGVRARTEVRRALAAYSGVR